MVKNTLQKYSAQRKKNRQQKKPQSGELNLCLGANVKGGVIGSYSVYDKLYAWNRDRVYPCKIFLIERKKAPEELTSEASLFCDVIGQACFNLRVQSVPLQKRMLSALCQAAFQPI